MLCQGQPQRSRRLPSSPSPGQVPLAPHAVDPGASACDEAPQVVASDLSLVRCTAMSPTSAWSQGFPLVEATGLVDAHLDAVHQLGLTQDEQAARLLQTAVVKLGQSLSIFQNSVTFSFENVLFHCDVNLDYLFDFTGQCS